MAVGATTSTAWVGIACPWQAETVKRSITARKVMAGNLCGLALIISPSTVSLGDFAHILIGDGFQYLKF
jgi:hypothetical protein